MKNPDKNATEQLNELKKLNRTVVRDNFPNRLREHGFDISDSDNVDASLWRLFYSLIEQNEMLAREVDKLQAEIKKHHKWITSPENP